VDDSGDSKVLLAARCLVASLFLWSGVGKITGYDEAIAFMSDTGTLKGLLPLAVAIEVGGAVMLVVGFRLRFTALLLAGFCLFTALLFHANFADRMQMFHLLKNVAIAGGLLALYVAGPGRLSLDGVGDVDDTDD